MKYFLPYVRERTELRHASDDPYGGVVAANPAVQIVLADLSAFCAEAARSARMEK